MYVYSVGVAEEGHKDPTTRKCVNPFCDGRSDSGAHREGRGPKGVR